MPARRFFAILESSRRLENKRHYWHMAELCDIAAIPLCNAEYYEQTRARFSSMVVGGTWKKSSGLKMDPKDPKTVAVITSIFTQKAKLEGLGG